LESKIWDVYAEEDVIPIAVGVGMDAGDWYQIYNPSALSYPLLCDITSSTYSSYYYDGYVPLNYVIDQDGIIQYRDSGLAMSAILAKIEQLYVPDYTLKVSGNHWGGEISLDYTIGSIEPATWSNYLVLLSPTQVIPLWSVSLPALDPPLELPISFPLPDLGWIVIYTTLTVDGVVQALDFDSVYTGK